MWQTALCLLFVVVIGAVPLYTTNAKQLSPDPDPPGERFPLLSIDTLLHVDNRGVERFFVDLNHCEFKLVTDPIEQYQSRNAFLVPEWGPITVNIAACIDANDDNVITILLQGDFNADAFIFIADLLLPGESVAYTIENLQVLPASVDLLQMGPNPFRISVQLMYTVPAARTNGVPVRLTVYDVLGREVRRLVDARRYPGTFRVTWDGRTDGGQVVASGVYFADLVVGTQRTTRRLVRIR